MLIAITGANGFLGSYLSDYLEKNDYKVRRIHRNKNKNKNGFFLENINVNTNWSKALDNVDIVIHCAAKVHVFNLTKDTKKAFYTFNVNATSNLAKQAAKIGVKKFIFISTIKVFGEKTKLNSPFSLSSNLAPEDHYAKSKLKAELVLKKITSENNMKLIIIRPPLIYGPGVGANFFKMISFIDKNYPIPLGYIKNKRSLIYLGNLSNFILTCLKNSKANGKVLLPTDAESLSTPDLIKKISFSLKKKVFLINFPKYLLITLFTLIGKGQLINKLINSLEINSNQTNKYINWVPPFSTNEGIHKTVQWFLSLKKDTAKN